MKANVSKGTIVRTIVLLIALLNSLFVQFGLDVLPVQEEQLESLAALIYEAGSHLFLIFTSLLAWWKNNSFTKEAIKADEHKDFLKRKNKF